MQKWVDHNSNITSAIIITLHILHVRCKAFDVKVLCSLAFVTLSVTVGVNLAMVLWLLALSVCVSESTITLSMNTYSMIHLD